MRSYKMYINKFYASLKPNHTAQISKMERGERTAKREHVNQHIKIF